MIRRMSALGTIRVELLGGLGNQLFQLAAANYLSLQLSKPIKLYADQIGQTHDGTGVLGFALPWSTTRRPGAYTRLLRRVSMSKSGGKVLRLLNERIVSNTQQALACFTSQPAGIQVRGYFDDLPMNLCEDFTTHFLPDLRSCSEWYLRNRRELTAAQPIAVHVRRGDFQLHPAWGVLSADYYARALGELEVNGQPIWVFTDDPESASQLLGKLSYTNVRLVQSPSRSPAVESFSLMVSARAFVGANSTLSFWVAMYREKESLLPKQFRPDSDLHTSPLRLPKNTRLVDSTWE